MSHKNIIRLVWPPLLIYLLTTSLAVRGTLVTPWATWRDAFIFLPPNYAIYGMLSGIYRLNLFYPHKLWFALGLLGALLALWFWKPNWFTGLLLVVPMYLLGPHTYLLFPDWAGVL